MLMWSNELLIGAESNILQYLITRPNKQLSTEVVMNAVMCSTVLNFVVNAPRHINCLLVNYASIMNRLILVTHISENFME
jgi:hypothetical protein